MLDWRNHKPLKCQIPYIFPAGVLQKGQEVVGECEGEALIKTQIYSDSQRQQEQLATFIPFLHKSSSNKFWIAEVWVILDYYYALI